MSKKPVLLSVLTLFTTLLFSKTLFAYGWHDRWFWQQPQQTLAELLSQSGGDFDRNHYDYDILLNAAQALNLVDALSNPDSELTVFAPVDNAFIRLAEDLGYDGGRDEQQVFEFIVNNVDLTTLTNIVLYHIAPESLSLRNVFRAESINTLLEDSTFKVFGYQLVDAEPDIKNPRLFFRLSNKRAVNGRLHAISRVLLPINLETNDPDQNIVEIVSASGSFDRNPRDFDLLLQAVIAAQLDTALADPNSELTVFAPNDWAFFRLARTLGYRDHYNEQQFFQYIVDQLTILGNGDPIPLLTNILLYHVSSGEQLLVDINIGEDIETLLTDTTFSVAEHYQLIDQDPGVRNPFIYPYKNRFDINASNGVIHTISRVLLPVSVSGQ